MVKASFYSDSTMSNLRASKTVFYSSTQHIDRIGIDWVDFIPSSNTKVDRVLWAESYDDPYGWYTIFDDTDSYVSLIEKTQVIDSSIGTKQTLASVARHDRYMVIEYTNTCK